MKLINLTCIAILFSLSALAGHDSGNGAGGVADGSRYVTFYSSGIFVDSTELSIDQVPQLSATSSLFLSNPSISAKYGSQYFRALVPSQNRKYFKVTPDKFTPELRAKLLAEYGRVSGLDVSKIVLFAITDIKNKTTYLLPEFYSLKTATEQMAILYHEAFWLVNPQAKYEKVVASEMLFQKYLENQKSGLSLMDWLETILTPTAYIRAAYGYDAQTGALNAISTSNGIPLLELFGSQAFKVDLESRDGSDIVLQNLFALQTKVPNSILVHSLIRKLSAGGLLHIYLDTNAWSGEDASTCKLEPYSNATTNEKIDLSCIASYGDNSGAGYVSGTLSLRE
jgi:hypothetical protein